MTLCQKLLKQESTVRRIESMQQSSATPSPCGSAREIARYFDGIARNHVGIPTSWFLGVAEDCCMLSILLTVLSCFSSFWHSVIPTSYFIFILVYIIPEHPRAKRCPCGDMSMQVAQ